MPNDPRMTTPKPERGITPREKQVIDLVCDGHSNADISLLLGISLDTVKCHLYSIFNKVGVESRLQLARKFYRGESDEKVVIDFAANADSSGTRDELPTRAG